jgi:OOP family OmpA-OmpF porin
MNHRYLGVLVVSTSCMLGSASAFANEYDGYLNEGHFYLGAGLGHIRIESEDFFDSDEDLRDNRTGWKLTAGGNYNPHFGLEVSYVDFQDAEDGPLTFESAGYSLAATAGAPLTETFKLYAKLGNLWWDADGGGADDDDSFDIDGNDTFYGVGAGFAVSPRVHLKLEYERYELRNTDIDMPSINVSIAM